MIPVSAFVEVEAGASACVVEAEASNATAGMMILLLLSEAERREEAVGEVVEAAASIDEGEGDGPESTARPFSAAADDAVVGCPTAASLARIASISLSTATGAVPSGGECDGAGCRRRGEDVPDGEGE